MSTEEIGEVNAVKTLSEFDQLLASAGEHVVILPDSTSFDYIRRQGALIDSRSTIIDLYPMLSGASGPERDDIWRTIALRIGMHGIHLRSLTVIDLEWGPRGQASVAHLLPAGLRTIRLHRTPSVTEHIQAIVERLPKLVTIDLGHNEIGDHDVTSITKHLANLPQLTTLTLTSNRIHDAGAQAIASHLVNLTTLRLADNEIGNGGARAIAEGIRNLETLDLSKNRIGVGGAQAIARHLPRLATLNLGGNVIGDRGAWAIAENLSKLATLDLSSTGVGVGGVRAIAKHLTNLTNLNLSNNRVGDGGVRAIAKHLRSLVTLSLENTTTSVLGASEIAEHLTELNTLYLGYNAITDDGASAIAERLPNLTILDLGDNGVGNEGARAIAKCLTKLTVLNLGNNDIEGDGIRALLTAFADRPPHLRSLVLSNNAGPRELGLFELGESDDAQALISAYRQLSGAAETPMGEAKLIVLGEEYVGKTSLVNALVSGRACDLGEGKTPGVNHQTWITPWSLRKSSSTPSIRLNIWDFGGQSILQQTHNFFLTSGCLYLVVLSSRIEDDNTVHDWLRTIAARAPDSPIIVVVNKCDDGTHNLDIDFARLQREHPSIIGIFNVSCIADATLTADQAGPHRSLEPLRQCIAEAVTTDDRIDSARMLVPRSWVRVRDELRELAHHEQVLDSQRYVTLCETASDAREVITDAADQRALLRILNQIGVVVTHGPIDRNSIDRWTLLDPNWLTDAVYALLSSAAITKADAIFDKRLLGTVLRSDPQRALLYSDERLDFIIEMMQDQRLALAFQLPSTNAPKHYLLPEALVPEAPQAIMGWDSDSLRVRYRYQQLPRGLIPQFQVLASEYFGSNPSRWRAGCIIEVDGCPVLVNGYPERKRIDISVTGNRQRRRDAIGVVRNLFGTLHSRHPEVGARLVVPLPDNIELDIDYEFLRGLEASDGLNYKVPVPGASRKYGVGELVAGIQDAEFHPLDLPDRIQVWAGGGLVLAGVAASLFGIGRRWEFSELQAAAGVGAAAAIGAIVGTGAAFAHHVVRRRK